MANPVENVCQQNLPDLAHTRTLVWSCFFTCKPERSHWHKYNSFTLSATSSGQALVSRIYDRLRPTFIDTYRPTNLTNCSVFLTKLKRTTRSSGGILAREAGEPNMHSNGVPQLSL
ncbi:unnamed protein product [Protopolystoma xenopodis]|uniref:Uncharacterized protein n=1 Tax=Protopolystoma xenopodis TaxID=117903 RepID=A0A3S5BA49_9PLAT|nr:unnamed protein product [Protopolystoma xenopodis]